MTETYERIKKEAEEVLQTLDAYDRLYHYAMAHELYELASHASDAESAAGKLYHHLYSLQAQMLVA
jgi:hypothetical protein